MTRPKGSKDKTKRIRSGNYLKIEVTCECGCVFIKCKNTSGSLCLKCRQKKNMKSFKEKHPGYDISERRKATSRAWQLKNKYNMLPVEYEEMLSKQGGVCAICKKEETQGSNLCVDHCHTTGKVRGLLCHKCNRAIGALSEKATMAAQYLISSSRGPWDEYFMHIALLTASRSKDRSTRVGSVIVRDRVILSTGYNGFPRGIDDDIEERHQRPEKYRWVCHAEENSILNAARVGVKVQGADLFVTLFPCSSCAKSIIQSEIARVIVLSDDNPRWTDEFELSKKMLMEAGVKIDYISI